MVNITSHQQMITALEAKLAKAMQNLEAINNGGTPRDTYIQQGKVLAYKEALELAKSFSENDTQDF